MGPVEGPDGPSSLRTLLSRKASMVYLRKRYFQGPFSKAKNEIRTGMLFSGRIKRQNILRKIKKMAGIKKLSNVLGIICKRNKQKIFAKYFGKINIEETRSKISLILWEEKF